ncbi:type 1 glutamine amidotransferase domain-containing protein [Fundidesulfovibrio terrae]|uniref:type 1 glutamine amidotransferase domain-containing protein n=1 Tax=Fundidesulfovibrio terrae TaxID=2922866 RepID=UPI001FAF7965|nr:type 1 glutamine amidotransferase domain-containing protein [Fundidesulfovibrio terrae]
MKILMVITSNGELGDTGRRTGVWLEELAAPYYVFRDAGASVTLASPKGGRPPVDPGSETLETLTDACRRFQLDALALAALSGTVRLADVSAADFDAVFYPGGHGPLWDLAEDDDSISIIETMFAAGKPVGAVCHGPAVLRHARKYDGTPLVLGISVTGFTNAEEKAVGLDGVVPFSLEDELRAKGGRFENAGLFQPHAVADRNLVTGQNPASSEAAARKLLALLGKPS